MGKKKGRNNCRDKFGAHYQILSSKVDKTPVHYVSVGCRIESFDGIVRKLRRSYRSIKTYQKNNFVEAGQPPVHYHWAHQLALTTGVRRLYRELGYIEISKFRYIDLSDVSNVLCPPAPGTPVLFSADTERKLIIVRARYQNTEIVRMRR